MSSTISSNTSSPITATITANITTNIPKIVQEHLTSKDNPHNVTCSQIGAMPYDENIVSDSNYVHTDNNFSNSYKSALDNLSTTYATQQNLDITNNNINTIQTDINSLNSGISSLNETTNTNTNDINSTKADIATLSASLSDINSNISSIESDIATLDNSKVDKISGKGLSTEDFTTELKEKLVSIDTTNIGSSSVSNCIQKNYLYNQEFTINQREKTLYPVDTADSYCVDRWQKGADVEVTYTNSTAVTTISNKSTTQLEGITQYIADDTTLLGKQVTFTVKTTEGTYSMTTEPLPLTPKTTHKNTIIQTQNTSFGALQIEFAKTHFLVRILINPATSDTDYTTITPVYAKLEQGLNFTGIDYKDKYSYLQECSQFYQKNPFRTFYTPGYRVQYSSYTQYFATCPLGTNFYSSTLKFEIKDGSYPRVLSSINGINDLIYDSVSITLKGPDKSAVAISMTINEDNSAILGDETSKYELCMFSFPNSSIDGEITS